MSLREDLLTLPPRAQQTIDLAGRQAVIRDMTGAERAAWVACNLAHAKGCPPKQDTEGKLETGDDGEPVHGGPNPATGLESWEFINAGLVVRCLCDPSGDLVFMPSRMDGETLVVGEEAVFRAWGVATWSAVFSAAMAVTGMGRTAVEAAAKN